MMTVSPSLTLTSRDHARDVALRSIQVMADGDPHDFEQVVHPDAVNREAEAEPPATRGHGPAAFYATALWLRSMFDDLAFEVHDVTVDSDLVVAHVTMSGRQVGPAVFYDADGGVAQAMPATGQRFAVTQSHWLRVRDGLVVEHWANRDDQGMATQLGWIPPSPLFLVRMVLATRRARRATARQVR